MCISNAQVGRFSCKNTHLCFPVLELLMGIQPETGFSLETIRPRVAVMTANSVDKSSWKTDILPHTGMTLRANRCTTYTPFIQKHIRIGEYVDGSDGMIDATEMTQIIGVRQGQHIPRLCDESIGYIFGAVYECPEWMRLGWTVDCNGRMNGLF